MQRILVSVMLVVSFAACSSDKTKDPLTIDKAAAFGAKADTDLQRRICRELGYPADCDVCDLAGWYGDGECDTFCNKPDSDCGTPCQTELDCPQIYCITSPCPQNVCVNGQCVQQDSNQCFGAWVDQNGGCRSANDGIAPAECCSCDGAVEHAGWPSLCINKYDVTVDFTCCTDPVDAGTPSCAAQDAQGVGLCEAFFGYAWDGNQCVGLSGCSCAGSDCADTFFDITVCEAAYSQCNRDGGMPGDCYVGGCSGQVCSDDPSVYTTCEWRPEYACYQDATCELQADGKCGWTDTPELQRCLDNGGPDTYDPCENKKCGDTCTVCPPNDPACTETAVLKSCDEFGSCTAGAPQCNPQDDCRTQRCAPGRYCSYCWTQWACIPDGAVC